MKIFNIAIVGATGLVGQTFLKVLAEYDMPIGELRLFASEKSVGKKISFKEQSYTVETIKPGSFKGIHYALFSAGASTSLTYAKQAVSEGAIVIDNSSAWRMDKNVPLIVPEVNLNEAYGHALIANPNCSTIQCMLPLKVLQDAYGIDCIEYNTYQAVSGAGQKGIDDLVSHQTSFFPYDISSTAIPQIDVFLADGYTKEEHKMMNETRKILNDYNIPISATCVRVPVLNSHAISIRVTLKEEVDISLVRDLFALQEGLVILDDPKKNIYPTSLHANDTDLIYIGRMRIDKINKKTILLYVVADNVRKGAASNAIQIMKGLIAHG